MVKSYGYFFMIGLLIFSLSACNLQPSDNDTKNPYENGDNTNDNNDDEPMLESGWYLVDSYFSLPDTLSYTHQTMSGEQGITTLTFLSETEGHVHLEIHTRWDGYHGNATTYLGEGEYLWEVPQTFVPPGGRARFNMSVNPISTGMNLKIVGHHTHPYEGSMDSVIFSAGLPNDPEEWHAYYIEGTTIETIMTRAFPHGQNNEKISIRIYLFNGSMGDIYWYYTYQWNEGHSND